MKTTLALAAAALLAASVPAMAQTRPNQPPPPANGQNHNQNHGPNHNQGPNQPMRPGQNNQGPQGSGPRPYMPEPGRPGGPNGGPGGDFGRWDSAWGARPPAPPSHFSRSSDWYRHVRACQQRYRSYNPRTDRFVPRPGQTAICRL